MKTATIKISSTISGVKLESEQDLSAGDARLVSEAVPKNSQALAMAIAFKTAKLKSLLLTADQAITVVFKDGHSDVSATVGPGSPFFWATGIGTSPFPYDITEVQVTEGNVAATVLEGQLLVDPT